MIPLDASANSRETRRNTGARAALTPKVSKVAQTPKASKVAQTPKVSKIIKNSKSRRKPQTSTPPTRQLSQGRATPVVNSLPETTVNTPTTVLKLNITLERPALEFREFLPTDRTTIIRLDEHYNEIWGEVQELQNGLDASPALLKSFRWSITGLGKTVSSVWGTFVNETI